MGVVKRFFIGNKFILMTVCDIIQLSACDIISSFAEGNIMEQTVYIDLFFLINFSMDFLGLFLATKLLGREKSILRLALSAIFGGVYACLALIFPLDSYFPLLSIVVDALACVAMAFIAVFKRKAPRGVISFALVYGAVSILLGGAMTALFYAFNRLGLDKAFSGAENTVSDGISVYIFAVFAAISGFITLIGGRFFKKKALRQGGTLEIEYRGRRVGLECMCDSGNLLREPISQIPCILIELEAVKKILPDRFFEAVKSDELEKIPLSESSRIRMIPAQSASGEALLIGMRPDKIILNMGSGAICVAAYLAFTRQKISANGARALVPSELAMCAV